MHQLLSCLARCFVTALLLAGLGASASAGVQDHITQRAYWEDTSSQATWQQAQTQTLTAFNGVFSRGYTTSAIWIRLQITPPARAKEDDKLVLRIRPIYLDEITLYDPLDTSGKLRQAGDRTEYANKEYTSLVHNFVIPAGHEPRWIWLRLTTTSTTLMHVEALSLADMQADEHRLQLLYSGTLALIMVFSIVTLINWFNYREFLYAVFIARNMVYFVYSAAFFGFHRYLLSDWLPAQSLDLGYSGLVISTTAFTIWFETRFLGEYNPPSWVKKTFIGLMLWSAFAFALLLLGNVHAALNVNMLLNGASVLTMLVVSSIFIDNAQVTAKTNASLLQKKYVVSYYILLALLLLTSVMPYLGKMAGSEFSANGLVYYALVSGFNMTLLMQLRAHQQRKANAQMQQDLALSAQQVSFEKIRRDEQSQLLTMLMHELKNPLAVIDLAQQSVDDPDTKDYVSRNVSIIRNVLDQCLSADRLSDGKLTIQTQHIDLIELLDELTESCDPTGERIALHLAFSPITIHTDYQCLRIVLNNLIDNALRYSDAAHPIQIWVESQHNPTGHAGLAITVINQPGMASWPDASKVFQKYYRSTGAKSVSGTGLGLFLVRSICQLLGGTCTYEPDDTHVRFKVWLPS
jgi:signal transduction histidine kinase